MSLKTALAAMGFLACLVPSAQAADLLKVYKHLHANPELSLMETETASYMAAELRSLGYDVTENFGGTGVVAVMKNGPGKTIMIRADMDGLPVNEQTGLAYASTVSRKNHMGEDKPAMHACGHDIHMTSLLGTAENMKAKKDEWSGTLILILQPAEEIVKGAQAMLADGLFTKFPRPDYNLGLHVNANLPAGQVGIVPGFALANVDSVDIDVPGVGGHGAYPHTTKDPIVLSAQIIMGLQTIVSRETSPLDAAVVTVGTIHGGTKRNIISDGIKLELTLRSYKDEVRAHTLEAIERMITNYGRAAGLPDEKLPYMTVHDESAPATYNDPVLTQQASVFMKAALGEENVVTVDPVMAAEDFSHFGRTDPKIPSLLFWLGAVSPKTAAKAKKDGTALPSLHSPFFAPDAKRTLDAGVAATSAAAIGLFNQKS
ncbi:MAG: amidohydrolase [Alphaproteobacteria bacterium]